MSQYQRDRIVGEWNEPEAYIPALKSYFLKRSAAHEADDLVQDVLLRMRSRMRNGAVENLRGYIFTVASNVLKDWRQARFRGADDARFELCDEITPERVVAARRDARKVVKAIEALPPRTREVFVAHRFEDMSYPAIARAQGISVSAVEKHIMLALKRLSAALALDG